MLSGRFATPAKEYNILVVKGRKKAATGLRMSSLLVGVLLAGDGDVAGRPNDMLEQSRTDWSTNVEASATLCLEKLNCPVARFAFANR